MKTFIFALLSSLLILHAEPDVKAGQPLTIDAIEAATTQLLRELGPQLMEDLIQGVEQDPKKGALPSAASTRPNTKGCSNERSPRSTVR